MLIILVALYIIIIISIVLRVAHALLLKKYFREFCIVYTILSFQASDEISRVLKFQFKYLLHVYSLMYMYCTAFLLL